MEPMVAFYSPIHKGFVAITKSRAWVYIVKDAGTWEPENYSAALSSMINDFQRDP